MYSIPNRFQRLHLEDGVKATILSQLIQARDNVAGGKRLLAMWLPEDFYDWYVRDDVSNHFMTNFINSFNYCHVVTGLQCVVMTQVEGEPPHYITPADFETRRENSFIFCSLNIKLRLRIAYD